jgi:MscS family membrane protein
MQTESQSRTAPDDAAHAPDESASMGSDAPESPPRPLDLSTPRAAMRAFLLAIQDAAGDQPERIDDAVRCFDVSGVQGEDVAERARQLARRLHRVIDRVGVKIDDIPETADHSAGYVFHSAPDPENALKDVEIRLARDGESAIWRFTASTLASIPALEKAVDKQKAVEKQAEPPKPEIDLPAARRSPRATMKTFLDAMTAKPRDIDAAIKCLDPTGQDPRGWRVRGEQLAIRLKNVMDKIRLVVYADIPEDSVGEPFVWEQKPAGRIVIGATTEAAKVEGAWDVVKGEWRFTPETLKALDVLYVAYEDQPIIAELRAKGVEEQITFSMWLQRRVPDSLRSAFLSLALWQWLALAVLIALGWFIKVVVAVIAGVILRVVLRRRHITIDRDLVRRAVSSSGFIFTVLFWTMVMNRQYLELPAGLLGTLLLFLKFGLVAAMMWTGYRVVDVVGGHVAGNRDLRLTQFDELLVPLLRQVFRFLVLLVVILFAMEYWFEKPPGAVMGALGIGGVALAFAAKDTLGNFFGSITVLLDRPFGPGDWVVVAGVEGTVEKVGFRSTRLRTFYNSVVTIPNSSMVNSNVDNYGLRRYRRTKAMISITYDTPPEKIDAFCEGIRELIRLHPYTRKDYYHVYFNQFAASSLDILLYLFFDAPDWSTELRERHRLFVDIMRLADKLGVAFAFPTQTLMVQQDQSSGEKATESIARIADDPDAFGQSLASSVFEEAYGPEPRRPGPVVIDMAPKSKG